MIHVPIRSKDSININFAYFSTLKIACTTLSKHSISKKCNAKVSIASFSAPNKLP